MSFNSEALTLLKFMFVVTFVEIVDSVVLNIVVAVVLVAIVVSSLKYEGKCCNYFLSISTI
jgi:hypothetical protein